MPDQVQWGALGQPKPERAEDVYTKILQQQALQRKGQQDQQYNQARIQEQQALAAQRQRVVDAKKAVSQAVGENLQFGEDGTPKMNYAAAAKKVADLGFGEESHELFKQAGEELKAHLENEKNRMVGIGTAAGSSYRVPENGWQDPSLVARARKEAMDNVDALERSGHLTKQEAAAARVDLANYNQEAQSKLDMYASHADTLGKRYDHAIKANTDLVGHLTGQAKIDQQAAVTDLAQTKATEGRMDLAGRTVGAGVVPANSDIGENAPQAANPYTAAPAGGGYASPQAAPAPATGNVDPRTGQPYTSPQVNTAPMSEDARAQGIRIPAPAAQSPGLITPGNIDLKNRQIVKNEDGTTSTVKTATFGIDGGRTVLLPTIVNGKPVSNADALQHYRQTGEHMGIFNTEKDADEYDKNLHNQMGWDGPPGSDQAKWQASAGRDPKWTPEKQAQWEAQRKDPNNRGVSQYMQGEWSQKKEDAIKRLGMNRTQQLAADDRETGADLRKTGTELDNQKKLRTDWSTKFQMAIDKGPGSYARTYDAAPPEIQKMMDDPDHFDQKAMMRRARLMGETAAQAEADQDRHDKPAGSKAATPGQLNTIETAKNAALKAAKNLYRKDTASVLGKGKIAQHLSTLRDATQNAQNEYENKLKQFGLEVKHMEYPPVSEWDKGGFPKTGASNNAPAAKAAPKSATMDQVKAYAAKSGKTEEQVIQEAKDSGIEVR